MQRSVAAFAARQRGFELQSRVGGRREASPLSGSAALASGKDLAAEAVRQAGFVAGAPLLWALAAGKSLPQQSPGLVGEPAMGLLREGRDSASACSKKTYLTARSSARPRVITCSRSMLEDREAAAAANVKCLKVAVWKVKDLKAFTWSA